MTVAPDADVVSKGQFARLANVSAGRVSQWIAEGKISGAALVGEGRAAQIRVSVAQQQLRTRIDVGQRFGNGIDTNLSAPATSAPMASPPPAPTDPVEEKIKREKLREIEFKNREAAEKELTRRGVLMRSRDASEQMVGIASSMLTVFEGALPDFASTIASQFGVPHRDVLHALRREMRNVRQRAAQAARKKMEGLPAEIVDDVDDPMAESSAPLQ